MGRESIGGIEAYDVDHEQVVIAECGTGFFRESVSSGLGLYSV